MRRYCVAQLDSNVVYLFSSQDQADALVRQLEGNKLSRSWSVEPKEQPKLTVNGHALIQFPHATQPKVKTCATSPVVVHLLAAQPLYGIGLTYTGAQFTTIPPTFYY
jgi:hypothetical protein